MQFAHQPQSQASAASSSSCVPTMHQLKNQALTSISSPSLQSENQNAFSTSMHAENQTASFSLSSYDSMNLDVVHSGFPSHFHETVQNEVARRLQSLPPSILMPNVSADLQAWARESAEQERYIVNTQLANFQQALFRTQQANQIALVETKTQIERGMKQLEEQNQQMVLRAHQMLSTQITDLTGKVANVETCLHDASNAFNSRMDRVDEGQTQTQEQVAEVSCKVNGVQSKLDEFKQNIERSIKEQYKMEAQVTAMFSLTENRILPCFFEYISKFGFDTTGLTGMPPFISAAYTSDTQDDADLVILIPTCLFFLFKLQSANFLGLSESQKTKKNMLPKFQALKQFTQATRKQILEWGSKCPIDTGNDTVLSVPIEHFVAYMSYARKQNEEKSGTIKPDHDFLSSPISLGLHKNKLCMARNGNLLKGRDIADMLPHSIHKLLQERFPTRDLDALLELFSTRRFFQLEASEEYLNGHAFRRAVDIIREKVFGYQDKIPEDEVCHTGPNWELDFDTPVRSQATILAEFLQVDDANDIIKDFRSDLNPPLSYESADIPEVSLSKRRRAKSKAPKSEEVEEEEKEAEKPEAADEQDEDANPAPLKRGRKKSKAAAPKAEEESEAEDQEDASQSVDMIDVADDSEDEPLECTPEPRRLRTRSATRK